MTSHASVNVMLALEDAFDVEFPDEMLKRSVFESVASIAARADPARGAGGMTVAADRDAAFLAEIRRDRRRRRRRRTPIDVDRNARFPVEAIAALREERALSALVPPELGGDGVSLRERSPQACFELGRRCGATAMVFAMHQIQVATIVRHARRRAALRGLPARRWSPSSG